MMMLIKLFHRDSKLCMLLSILAQLSRSKVKLSMPSVIYLVYLL